MLQTRIIPCLLLHKGGLVKTVGFKKPNYIGDPLNAVQIFNKKEVDELIVIDIDATIENRGPDYKLIENIASECFMPLCYGGGVKNIEQMRRLYSLGIEKLSLSSVVLENDELLSQAADIFGRQSVVVTMDVKCTWPRKRYRVVSHRGKKKYSVEVLEFARSVARKGAGELVIHSVDHDGKMTGYDQRLVKMISNEIDIPVIALGGAGSLGDMKEVVIESGACAAAAGSLFVYSGIHNAVLINYPSPEDLSDLFRN